MITEEITIRHLDIIIDSMNVVGKFSVLDILTEKADFDWNKDDERSDFNKLRIEVERLGKMYGYLDPVNNRPGIFTLTEQGIEAKRLKGHLKYQKSLNKKIWYNENWVGYLIALIVLLFSVYQYFENDSLKNEYDSLKSEYDSLKSEYDLYKDSVFDSKEQIELNKTNSLKDTLQTKSLND